MPVPAPHRSHLARSDGAASASVGNNDMGKETLRPSNSSTFSSSLVTFTALILWSKKLILLLLLWWHCVILRECLQWVPGRNHEFMVSFRHRAVVFRPEPRGSF